MTVLYKMFNMPRTKEEFKEKAKKKNLPITVKISEKHNDIVDDGDGLFVPANKVYKSKIFVGNKNTVFKHTLSYQRVYFDKTKEINEKNRNIAKLKTIDSTINFIEECKENDIEINVLGPGTVQDMYASQNDLNKTVATYKEEPVVKKTSLEKVFALKK